MKLTTTISDIADDVTSAVNRTVAEISERTPDPLAPVVRRVGNFYVEVAHQSGRFVVFTVEVVEGVVRVVATGVSSLEDEARRAFDDSVSAARSAGEATVGAIDDAVDRIGSTARSASDRVGRNLRAVEDTADAVDDEIDDAVEQGADAVAGAADTALESAFAAGADMDQLTKDELYERAQQLDIEGRSTMSKVQLIAALKSA